MKYILLTAAILAIAVTAAPAAPAHERNPEQIWVITNQQMKPAEQLMIITLQGLTASDDKVIWFNSPGAAQLLLGQMKSEGVTVHEAASAWDLLREFRPQIKGAILCKLGTESVNAATSLCGIEGRIAVDESIADSVRIHGIPITEDARQLTDRQMFDKHARQFRKGVAISLSPTINGNLRDFAVARRAFMFGNTDYKLITDATRAAGPTPFVYGWGNEEAWVRAISAGNGVTVPADWSSNLSVIQRLPTQKIKRLAEPPVKMEDHVRYIAFVISDGDNLQFLCGRFLWDKRYWSNPLRGKFPVTWEIPTVAAEVTPRILEYIYSTATPNDGIVSGAGLPGYTYAYLHPDRGAVARQGAKYLKIADLTVSSVINDNKGALEDYLPLLDQPEVKGLLYKPFYPYDGGKGRIVWHNGKPIMAFKFMTWPQRNTLEQMVAKIAQMPASPRTDENSYALVSVCAWHHEDIGGPMEAIRRVIDMLPKDTRVVTANQLIDMMSETLGKKR